MAESTNFGVTEFSAFGPWVYEISDVYPMPRLFVPCFTDDDQAIMKVKVPRKIDRRDAEPDMDLYDYVIAMYEDHLRILERQDTKVAERIITADEFVGVRLYNNLLQGACTILSKDSSTSFSYNTVSSDVVMKLTNLAFEKLGDKKPFDTSALPVTLSEPESELLASQLFGMNMDGIKYSVGAVQKSVELRRIDNAADNIVERVIWTEMNPEAVHLFTDDKLITIQNGSFPVRVGTPDYGYTYTMILPGQISSIDITNSSKYAELKDLTINVGTNKIVFHYDEKNTEVFDFFDAVKAL